MGRRDEERKRRRGREEKKGGRGGRRGERGGEEGSERGEIPPTSPGPGVWTLVTFQVGGSYSSLGLWVSSSVGLAPLPP